MHKHIEYYKIQYKYNIYIYTYIYLIYILNIKLQIKSMILFTIFPNNEINKISNLLFL